MSKITPKFDNIVGTRLNKQQEKSSNGIKIIGADNDDTALINVIAVGDTCVDTVVGQVLLVPLSAIRIIHEGSEYIICSERSVYATISK